MNGKLGVLGLKPLDRRSNGEGGLLHSEPASDNSNGERRKGQRIAERGEARELGRGGYCTKQDWQRLRRPCGGHAVHFLGHPWRCWHYDSEHNPLQAKAMRSFLSGFEPDTTHARSFPCPTVFLVPQPHTNSVIQSLLG